MKVGYLIEIVCRHSNGGAQWSRGGPGVTTFDSPQNQRWFPNGTLGVVVGRTCPKAKKSDWHRSSLYEVLIDGGVYTLFRQDLRVISAS